MSANEDNFGDNGLQALNKSTSVNDSELLLTKDPDGHDMYFVPFSDVF